MTETSKIKCPKCGTEISVDDVLHAQIEIRIRGEYEEKQQKEKDASRERNLAVGQDEKQQILYQYITGNQFRQRVGTIIDVFKGFQEDLEKEKRSFKTRWSKTEKRIERVMDNILGMQGDLEGMVSLPAIPALELGFDDNIEEEIET